MNDGCSRISSWAMGRIQIQLGLDYLPSVVQGRIFGAKGLWYRDDDDWTASCDESSEEPPEGKKLISISKSQIKVRRHPCPAL